MPERPAKERAKSFQEVACGYTLENALREAERCLLCPDAKCIAGCPVSIDIPEFIRRISARDFRGAYDAIAETNLLPAICGRVCPQESQCEGVCTVGDTLEPVAIGRLERWVGDKALAEGWSSAPYVEPNGFRVGIVGSGPAGMACAADMAKAGCDVTVYEAFQEPGGVLKYGIPDFRLPNPVIDAEIENLRKLGVRFECNTLVGRLFTIEQMIDEMGFHAVFIGTGAGYPSMMGIPGESLNGVLSANELLTRCNLMRARDFPRFDTPLPAGRRVAVIGSGNTAMDALRVSLRLGAEKVHCIYRRSRAESPARAEELHHAEEEGIEFHWLTNPLEILDDGKGNVRGMRCIRMKLGEPDSSGRPRPEPVAGSEFEFSADMVVYAIGTNANPIIGQTSKIGLNKRGYIQTTEDLETSLAGVFAGGDIVTGAATVIEAMGAGRKAARAMKEYLGISGSSRAEKLFGIDLAEHNYVRLRAA
jgi:glutamate synthase (NADPH/NADH) small chain